MLPLRRASSKNILHAQGEGLGWYSMEDLPALLVWLGGGSDGERALADAAFEAFYPYLPLHVVGGEGRGGALPPEWRGPSEAPAGDGYCSLPVPPAPSQQLAEVNSLICRGALRARYTVQVHPVPQTVPRFPRGMPSSEPSSAPRTVKFPFREPGDPTQRARLLGFSALQSCGGPLDQSWGREFVLIRFCTQAARTQAARPSRAGMSL